MLAFNLMRSALHRGTKTQRYTEMKAFDPYLIVGTITPGFSPGLSNK